MEHDTYSDNTVCENVVITIERKFAVSPSPSYFSHELFELIFILESEINPREEKKQFTDFISLNCTNISSSFVMKTRSSGTSSGYNSVVDSMLIWVRNSNIADLITYFTARF